MDPTPVTTVNALGVLMAAACVVGGSPLFARGLRALRLRRLLTALAPHALSADSTGCVLVRGRVALESPLFAPLSGRPCAGFVLTARAAGGNVGGTVRDLRPFRLVGEDTTARVVPGHAQWNASVTAERHLAPGEQVPARLRELLERSADVRWLMHRRAALVLVEQAIEVGAEVSVLGVAHRLRAHVAAETVTLAATGTDGASVTTVSESFRERTPELSIEADEPLRQVVVASETPSLAALMPPRAAVLQAAAGPVLTMGGLLYLARAASVLIVGRF